MKQWVLRHRWAVLAGGAGVQLLAGVPAAWGVFQQGVQAEYGFSREDAAFILSVVVCCFGIGCVLGGALQDKLGARTAALAGSALLGGGFFAAGFLPAQLPWAFYGAFGVPAGLGCALLYPAVMTCAQKHYADKKGFATGVIGTAAGCSGAVLAGFAWLFGTWLGERGMFCAFGVLIWCVCGGASLLMVEPPQASQANAPQTTPKKKPSRPGGTQCAQKQGTAQSTLQAAPKDAPRGVQKNTGQGTPQDALQNASKSKKHTASHGSIQLRPGQVLRTKQFWLLFGVVALATPTVLLFSPVVVQMAEERGIPQGLGVWCIVVGSLFSGAGRLLMPWLSDSIGRRYTDMLMFAALGGLSVAFIFTNSWWFLGNYALLTFCYSGEAAVLPAAGTDLFGTQHAGVNYGLLALGMSAGSVLFPPLARWLGGGLVPHIIAIAAAAVGFVLLIFLKPTQGERL